MHWKIGFHTGANGDATGIGDYFKKLDSAGIPAALVSADNYGPCGELAGYSGAEHVIAFRYTKAGQRDGNDYDVPNYSLSPRDAALNHWQLLKSRLQKTPEFNRSKTWLIPCNELDKNRAAWIGAFMYHITIFGNEDGFKIAGPGWSGGEPEPEDWAGADTLGWLAYCAENPNMACVAVHEYSFSETALDNGSPYLVGRFQQIFGTCDQNGIDRPPVIISEFGWTLWQVPGATSALPQLTWAAGLYAAYPEVLGAAIWYLGGGFNGIANKAQKLIAPVTEAALAYSPPPPPPPPPDPRTAEEVLWDASIEEQKQRGLTINTEAGLINSIARDGFQAVHNEIIVADGGDKFTIQAAEHLTLPRRVYVWQPEKPIVHFEDPRSEPPPEPKEFVVDTYPVLGRTPHVTDYFNAPRNYANGLHEGLDLRVIDGSGQMPIIVAGQDGVVEFIRAVDAGTDYGIYIILKHEGFEPGVTWYTWYCHLSEVDPNLSVGDAVSAGRGLGFAGSSGNSTGAHLHFMVQKVPGGLHGYWVNNVVDPLPLIPALDNPPPPTTKLDMAKYFFPPDGREFGHIYILRNNWGAGDERVQLQRDGDYSYVTKNRNWEKRLVGSDYIDLVMDTSPEEGKFYTVKGHWLPRLMGAGQVFDRLEHVEWFFDNCQPVPERPPADSHNQIRLSKHHEVFSGPDGVAFNDVVQLDWILGSKVAETYWFAAEYGLIQWLAADARMSWVREIIPDGSQENNTRKQINCVPPTNGTPEWEVLGVDVSHWQGTMDWKVAGGASVRFAFVKATEGSTYTDPELGINLSGALTEGIFASMYHFYRPNADAIAQANHFSDAFNFYINILPKTAMPIIDLEAAPTNLERYHADLLAFIDQVKAKTGRDPMIYTRAGFYDPYLQGIGLEQYPLWIAHYTNASSPLLPKGVTEWEFWQWTNSGTGSTYGASSQFIDLNRFNGTLAEFETKYLADPPPPPADCIGTPPDPYVAVRYWVDPSASCAQQLTVFAEAMKQGVTFCWSLDEALQGNLPDKTAVLWHVDPADRGALVSRANERYPETKIEFRI